MRMPWPGSILRLTGLFIPGTAIEQIPPPVNATFRALLNLPQDTPVVALTLPITRLGWRCLDIRTPSHLLFQLGYHEALDGRNTVVRVMLRYQTSYPLPLGEDDASQANRLLGL